LTVPAAAIRPVAYEISLQGAADTGAFADTADYHFTAVKPSKIFSEMFLPALH
jgi:hypothetical protein